jgi:hypothetical protein
MPDVINVLHVLLGEKQPTNENCIAAVLTIFIKEGATMKSKLVAILAVGLLAGPMAAQAIPITREFNITATDFTLIDVNATPLPISPVVLDLSVSFDNAADILATTAGLTVNSFNLPYALEYAYSAFSDILTLATDPGPNNCGTPANSFCTFIDEWH